MADTQQLLQQLLIASRVPPDMAPPEVSGPIPGADAGITMSQPQAPSKPNFMRELLSDFIGTLAQNLKSGAFQRGVARGVQGARVRGGKPGDAFVGAMGAVSEEQEQSQNRNVQLQQILAEQKRREEAFQLSKKRETRLEGEAKERNKIQLAQKGLRLNEAGDIEPIPEDELSAEVKSKIHANKAMENYRNALVEVQQARLSLQQAQLSQNQERIGIARENLNARMAYLGLAQKQFEANFRGTIGGEPIPGGPVDAEGNPVGVKIFTATKPTIGETQAAAAIRTAEGTVERVSQIIGDIRKSVESSDVAGFLTSQRELKQQGGLLANISRSIGGERGAQTEQDINRALALLPSTTDVLIDMAAASKRVERVVTELNRIVQRNKDIFLQQPNVRKVFEGATKKKETPKGWEKIQ